MSAADAANAHDPEAHTTAFARRADDVLVSDLASLPADVPTMADANFYVLHSQGKVPDAVLGFIDARVNLHCAVALAEISISAGILDPPHPKTRQVRSSLLAILDAIDLSSCRSPSPAAWAEAGMLSGILARTQHGLAQPKKSLSPAERCCQDGRRRALLNDVLIFLTAREQNAVVISSNISDMDLLLRFRPDTHVLLYRQVGADAVAAL